MAIYFNSFGSQTLSGTTGADSFYLFNRSTSPSDLRVDAFFPAFTWTTQLLLAGGASYQLSGININASTDLLIGDKFDAIYGSGGNDFIAYNNGTFNDGLGGFQAIQLMYLGDGDDIVDLTAHGPGGVAYAKDTKIYAGNGNDWIVGGAGSDLFYGEAGNDTIIGFAGADTIYGGLGDDQIYGDDLGYNGSRSYDTLYGNEGNDILYGGGRDDTLDGGADNDILYGGWGGDAMFGREGNDILWGDDGADGTADNMDGGSGNDQLFGVAGNDLMYGGSGDDLLSGDDGNDTMFGDAGIDTLRAGAGNDNLDGGADADTAVFTGNRSDYLLQSNLDGSVTLTDQRPGSPDGIDRVINVEWFQFADLLVDATQLSTPPTIVSNGGGASAAVNFAENGAGAVTTVQATDPDLGQTLTYRILGGADAALFTINGATGALSFAAAPDFENAIDADGDGIYEVLVGADDNAGGIGQQLLLVTIDDVADGNAPVIVGGSNAAVAADENGLAVATIAASDLDGDPLTYSIVGGADAALFAIDVLTGVLTFVAPQDYELPGDANADNAFLVVVAASDGINSAWQTVTVALGNLNDNAPTITSYGGSGLVVMALDENGLNVGTVTASDADSSALTYAISGGDDADRFVIDAATGVLTFAANPDFEVPLDANGDNLYHVTVSVTDGLASAAQEFAITLRNLNDSAPVITSNGGGATAAIAVLENATAVTSVTASDPDGLPLTYRIAGGADAALFAIDAATGVLRFLAASDFEHPLDAGANSIYDVIVAVSDGVVEDQQALAVTVGDVNEIGVTLNGNGASEIFSPNAASASLRTTALNDTINANGGNDSIDGGAGADVMNGGLGNDTYYVDTWSDNNWAPDDDQVTEAANAGTDTVFAAVSYRLTANVETLRMQGTAALSGWGNDLANTIVGNAGANVIDGGLGNDTITGNDGDDTILGGAGNDNLAGNAGSDWLQGGAGGDLLDGGTGADRMEGGADNDTYYVDSWTDDGNSGNDDLVIELAAGGTDTVFASVTYALTGEVEKLTLNGTTAIDGTGNALGNTITGNAAVNRIWGLAGNDIIDGGAGDDTIDGGDGNDNLKGNTGNDLLLGGLMVDTLDGGTGNDQLFGGDSNDTLLGQAGTDLLSGDKGKDLLTGGADADTFLFAFGDTSASAGFQDTISDFATLLDSIDIDVFGAAPFTYAETAIGTANYADGLVAAQSLAAGGAQAVFVAGSTLGWLFWDGNGDGAIDQALILSGVTTVDGFSAGNII